MPKTGLGQTLQVHEILLAIQGESTHIGRLCVLIRLAGCAQECRYCDTPEARSFNAGRPMTIAQILKKVESQNCRLVEITGGEPLAQDATIDLARGLIEAGYEVLVETSGCLPVDRLPVEVVKVMDLKCPASGECESNDWSNIAHLDENDEVKFVISDRADYEWAFMTVREHRLTEKCAVLFSPAMGMLEPRRLAEWILDDKLPVRFQIQLHKCVWGPGANSV